MLEQLKAEWFALKSGAPGERFVAAYERHQARDAPYLKPAMFFGAVFLLVIGIVFAIDHTAIAFACFLASTALFASDCRDVARLFDFAESKLRGGHKAYTVRRSRRTTRIVQHAQIDQKAVEAALRSVEQRMRGVAPEPYTHRPVVHAQARLTPQPLFTPAPQREPEQPRRRPQRRVASTVKIWSVDH